MTKAFTISTYFNNFSPNKGQDSHFNHLLFTILAYLRHLRIFLQITRQSPPLMGGLCPLMPKSLFITLVCAATCMCCQLHVLPVARVASCISCKFHVLPVAHVDSYTCCQLHVLLIACVASCMCTQLHVLPVSLAQCAPPPHCTMVAFRSSR